MQCPKYNFMHVRQNMITLFGNLDVITGWIIDNIVYLCMDNRNGAGTPPQVQQVQPLLYQNFP